MPFHALAGRMIETAHEFMALTWKVLPFFLLGMLIAAVLSALVGIPLYVCEGRRFP